MTPERLRKIEELYHAIRQASADERTALLAQTDPELCRELESLLAERSGERFLDRPAIEHTPELLWNSAFTLPGPGDCLGPYRLESKIGEGGMGQVFRAVDTRLDRAVAIKITREQFSARFEREARAISALNHPHICTLYDVGTNYLVMEHLEGETLATRLKQGALVLQTTLLYASHIVSALVDAHGKGIIHRDLKPGNIMIGKFGVKVLDFGLARIGQDDTVTASHMIAGTPAYMAPEQREGKSDARSDIYAFGCVLYEMLTGVRAGSTRKGIQPRKLQYIVTRCLEEDPGRRWQSAAELQRELAAVGTPGRRTYVAAAAMLLAVVAAYFALHRPQRLTAKDTIVLADFENKTSDPVFDQTLRQGLAVQLQQSPFLSLVSDQKIRQVLRLMKRPPEAQLTPEVTREVCERVGATAVLEGSIAGLGNQYVLWLRARNCRSGEVLAEVQAQAESKEHVLNALSRSAVQLTARLGESLATIQEHSKPLQQATTASFEALKAYSEGMQAVYASGGPRGFAVGIPHLQRAIAIDPQFAMAHAHLGFFSWNMGQTDLGAEHVRKAHALRDRVSERERFYILMLYDRQVTGNLQNELHTLESWVQTYPRDVDALAITAGWVALGTARFEMGVKFGEESIRIDPDFPFGYAAAQHYLHLGRYAEATEVLRRAAERRLEIPEMLITRYYLAFLQGDQPGMDREIARAPGEHAEDMMSHNQALVLARSGQMRKARTHWERAIALARQAGKRETVALYEAAQAWCEAHLGNDASAKQRARAALGLARGRDVEYAAAFALARSGDIAESQKLAADLDKRFPEDTPVQFEYLPVLRALAALSRHAPLEAVERLQRAVPYDLAIPGTGFFGHFGGLYTAYLRGAAYLAAGRGQEAVAEFQKVLDHRGIVLADPIGALAHLQMGRAYVVSGDKDKARGAYRDFLALWTDADADTPVLQQAQAEYARL